MGALGRLIALQLPKAFISHPSPSTFVYRQSKRTMGNMFCNDSAKFNTLGPIEVDKKLKGGWSPFILDVRAQTEHDVVALPSTDKVSPHTSVEASDVPEEGDILVYCKAGRRGAMACERLVELGVDAKRITNLEGGINGWRKDIDPSMPEY